MVPFGWAQCMMFRGHLRKNRELNTNPSPSLTGAKPFMTSKARSGKQRRNQLFSVSALVPEYCYVAFDVLPFNETRNARGIWLMVGMAYRWSCLRWLAINTVWQKTWYSNRIVFGCGFALPLCRFRSDIFVFARYSGATVCSWCGMRCLGWTNLLQFPIYYKR